MATMELNLILSEAGLLVEKDKATEQMKKSIEKFASLLTCPLCNKIFDRPATLCACSHTFCMKCIDMYSARNSECPVESCRMPLSIVGSNGGSFRKLNLQISQTIESLQLICQTLNDSKENWWLSPSVLQSIEEMRSSKLKTDLLEASENEEEENDPAEDSDVDGEDEEMIDLQANEDEQSVVQSDDENL